MNDKEKPIIKVRDSTNDIETDTHIGKIPSGEMSLIYLLSLFKKYRRKIILLSLIVGILTALLMFFVLDPIFLSMGTIKSTSKAGGLSSLLASGGIPDFGDIGSIAGGFGPNAQELALYENILMSRRCVEETIYRFNLNNEWKFEYMYDATKHFRENVIEVKKDKIAGTMEIGVYDKDPERAKEIVDFLIFQLNKIYTELNVQNASNNRQFIESRYNLVKEDLRKAEDSLKLFQDVYGVAPDITVKAAAQSEIELETQIKSEEIKLELLRKILSPDQSEILAQEGKISALNEQLNKIKTSNYTDGFLSLKGAPDLIMNYLRLQRELEIQNKILTFILPLFEQAKIEEKKETPTLLILDYPNVPDRKVKPKRLTNVALSILFTFIASFIFFVFLDKFRTIKGKYNF